MKATKKIISVLLSFVLVATAFTSMPFSVSAVETDSASVGATNGTTGDCTWALDEEGLLTISGNGEMDNYSYNDANNNTIPWGTGVNNVVINNGVKNIGNYAFYNCTTLKCISIPNSVTSIGNDAFYGCRMLTTTSIGKNVTSIGSWAFSYCYGLTNLILSDSIIKIGPCAFSSCINLANITIPNSVTSIGDRAFSSCTGLKGITLPNNISTIEYRTFYDCLELTNITIPNGVKSIEELAFEGCTKLMKISIPESVTCIEKRAFYNCHELSIVEVSEKTTDVGYEAFFGTDWYNNQPDGLVYVGSAAYKFKNSAIAGTKIEINEGTKSVTAYSFEDCTKLSNIALPNSVTSIGECSFQGCTNLANIIIPSSVTFIGQDAFKYCLNLSISGYKDSYAQIYAKNNNIPFVVFDTNEDIEFPSASLSSTNNVASAQTVTISLSDNVGIKGYYWGTSSSYSNNSYTSTSSPSISKTVDSAGTYYATAVDTSGNVSSTVSITFYKTTLNANGGSISQTSVLTKSGNSFTFPTPTRSNYTYVGWGTSSSTSASNAVKTLSPSSNATYYAVWSYVDSQKPTASLSSTNNVASSQTVTISLSDNVGIKGYYWGTSSSYSNNSYTSTSSTGISKTVDSAGTYYATAVDTSGNVSSTISITFYKTTLNANGGSVSQTSVLTKSGNSFTFPTPTRSIYSYVGWSTSSSATSGIKSLTPTGSNTYYAVWKNEKKNISDCTVTLSPTSYYYDGTAKTPAVTVKDGSTILTKDTDYTVSYSHDTNAGTATVTITGKGSYTGFTTKTFTINPKSISSASVTLSPTSYTYDGTEKKPSVTVKDGTKTLTNGRDYSVSYANNINVGTATVTVAGKGNYTDSKTVEYIIRNNEGTDDKNRLLGDADGDGNISISDATIIQKHLAEYPVTNKFTVAAADVDISGTVTISDATCIQKYLAEYPISERIGYPISDLEQETTRPSVTEPTTTIPVTTAPITTMPVVTEPITTEPPTEPAPEQVITYDNGDTVFVPSESNLKFDIEEAALYYNNTLSVYLTKDISASVEQRLAELCNGEVVGRIKGVINILQIRITPTDLTAINRYSDMLMLENNVLYATYEFPLSVDFDADNNPWSYNGKKETDKGNETTPNGNDWWAEAIGAYSAWKYTDSGLIETPAKVGVIDNGLDSLHEEFYDNNHRSKVTTIGSSTSKDHGTHVSGIIAAHNNNTGIRGIADSSELIFDSFGEHEQDTVTPHYAECIKEMVDKGAFAINLSWGIDSKSEEAYYKEKWVENGGSELAFDLSEQSLSYKITFEKIYNEFKQTLIKNGNGYQDYLTYLPTLRKKTSAVSVLLIIQLFYSQKDVLIVQASGNDGENVSGTGFFRGIDKTFYDTINNSLRKIMSYEDIRNHIIVVGAVENMQEAGRYIMGSYSNLGDNVDIVAPGGNILSTLTTKDDSSDPKDDNNGKTYGASSGTSMAAPMVTGSAVLLKSLDPTLSSAEIKDILVNKTAGTAVKGNSKDTRATYPMLNVGEATKYVVDRKAPRRVVFDKHFVNESIPMYFYGESIANALELHSKLSADPSGTFYLTNDIDFGEDYGTNWEMIPEFKGTLYGNGYSIINLCSRGDGTCGGMFRKIDHAKFYNIGFEKTQVSANGSGDTYVGTLAAFSDSSVIENCYITPDSRMLSASRAVGGFVGVASKTDFKDLYMGKWISGASLYKNPNVSIGGIAGECKGYTDYANHPFENCVVSAFFDIYYRGDVSEVTGGQLYIGGMVGKLDASTGTPETGNDLGEIWFSNCRFEGGFVCSVPKSGTPSCAIYGGGLIGYAKTERDGGMGCIRISGSQVKCDLSAHTAADGYVGGMIGYAEMNAGDGDSIIIEDTVFNGELYVASRLGSEKCNSANVGGMIGYVKAKCSLNSVTVKGTMRVKSEWSVNAGKLVGEAVDYSPIISNATATIIMNIDSDASGSRRNIGGMVGKG